MPNKAPIHKKRLLNKKLLKKVGKGAAKTFATEIMFIGGYKVFDYAYDKIYDKIIGHHPGWANKETEATIDSDFTAGRSYTREGAKKESIPWVQHGILTAAAFMTGLDRAKSLKGGLAGAGFAAGLIGLRSLSESRTGEDWKGLAGAIWGGIEFSATTSLLGSSMMKGGFLHKPIGVPVQEWINTKGYKGAIDFIQKAYDPKKVRALQSGRSTKGIGARIAREALTTSSSRESLIGAAARMGSVDEFALYMKDIASKARLGKLSQVAGPEAFPSFIPLGMRKKFSSIAQKANERVISKYYGETYNFLKGVAHGPRGPFEVTTGLGEFSERLLSMTENTQKEFYNAMMTTLAPKGGVRGLFSKPIAHIAAKSFGKPLLEEAFFPLKHSVIDVLGKKISPYKAIKSGVKYRRYFEGIFGSPVVGENVLKYGSIQSIPTSKYITSNIQDVFYGATPGILLASPFIAFEAAKIASGKAINKIIGHHPGWANKKTEKAINSDFTAGKSWTGSKNAFEETKYKSKSLRRGQIKDFKGFAPTIQEIREAAKKGFTFIGESMEEQLSSDLAKNGEPTRIKGLTYRPGGGIPLYLSDLDVVNPIENYRKSAKFRMKSAGFESVDIPNIYSKLHSSDWLVEGSKNRRFSESTRKSLQWAAEHTTLTENLGDVYRKYGAAGGRKYLESRFGDKFENLVFRSAYSERGKGVWLGLGGLSKRERLTFTGISSQAKLPSGVPNIFTSLPKAGGARESVFRQHVVVSKKFNFAQEYRVVYAGGEAVDITHRWGSKGVMDFFDKNPILKKITKSLGIESGYPELIQPVGGETKTLLKEFTKKYYPNYFEGVGAYDIGLIEGKGLTQDALKVIESQPGFGNISNPLVREKVIRRLTGKWSPTAKMTMGIAAVALAGLTIGKIIGHHPGRMNKRTEEEIDSDFTAGMSWTGVKNALSMFAKNRRKSLVSTMLATTLATTPTSVALAKDIGMDAAKALKIHTVSSAAVRSSRWRDVVDTVTALTDKNPVTRKKAAQLMYETGVHESGFLKHVKQIGGGPASGLAQVEAKTAKDIVQNYAKYRSDAMDLLSSASGKTKKDLLKMSGEELGVISQSNAPFNAVLERFKYKRVSEALPDTFEGRAAYWAKNYWVGKVSGKTTEEIAAMRAAKAIKYKKSNLAFKEQVKTSGLTNTVLHEKRTQHQVMDVTEKTKHLFNIK